MPDITRPNGEKPSVSSLLLSPKLMNTCEVRVFGPAIAGILTGSFVIETIFQIPGLGREFVNSAFNRDYTLILGTVILYAGLLVIMNLVVDVVQVWLNPKLKFE